MRYRIGEYLLFGLKAFKYGQDLFGTAFLVIVLGMHRPRKHGDTEQAFAKKDRRVVFHFYIVCHKIGAGEDVSQKTGQ